MRGRVFCGMLAVALGAVAPCGAQFTLVGGTGVVDRYAGQGAWGDYDGDGALDIALTGINILNQSGSAVWRNVGGGAFADAGANLPPLRYSSAAWGDYDNDGDPDLLLTGLDVSGVPVARLHRNDGGGSFPDIGAGLQWVYAGAAAWGDYNNDGRLDVLLTGTTGAGTQFSAVYRNNGGSFTNIGAALQPVTCSSAAWGDYDGDGDPDIALAGLYGSAPFSSITAIYRNNGNGSFTDINAGLPGIDHGALAWADYDCDGDLDLAANGNILDDTLFTGVFRNDGGGVFTDIGGAFTGVWMSSVAWADCDNDGWPDLAFTGLGDNDLVNQVWRNDQAGGFVLYVAPPGLEMGTEAWGDYDNDGRADLLQTGRDEFHIPRTALWHNTALHVNMRPEAPTVVTPSGAAFSGIVTLEWDAPTTDETPEAAMTYNLRVGTSPVGCNVVSADMDDAHPSNDTLLGNVQNGTFAKLRGLPQGTYYWAVQAVDAGCRRSEWSREGKFIRTNSVVIHPPVPWPPAPLPTAVATGVTPKSATAPTPTPAVPVVKSANGKTGKR